MFTVLGFLSMDLTAPKAEGKAKAAPPDKAAPSPTPEGEGAKES